MRLGTDPMREISRGAALDVGSGIVFDHVPG
jgi:hypothetical protein